MRRALLVTLFSIAMMSFAWADDFQVPPNGTCKPVPGEPVNHCGPCDKTPTQVPPVPADPVNGLTIIAEDIGGFGAHPSRVYACVSDGNAANGNELYVGGDLTTVGGPRQCMHIEVAGQVIIRRPSYPNNDPDRYCH